MSRPLSIIIVESSSIIFEGLSFILNKSGTPLHVMHASNLQESEKYFLNQKRCIVIVNPSFIQNNIRTFNNIKNEHPAVKWIAFIYAYFDSQIISQFDGVISISDSPESIIMNIKKIYTENANSESGESLSDRETEVLQLMATGLANKEIAERLNISINTVITHRKNISQKTGIKSISGLTIYAVTKRLISLDNI